MAILRLIAALLALLLGAGPALAEWPAREGDFVIRDFRFGTGQTLPELRQHYRTIGTPHRGADGLVDNAVMIMHGTGGSGAQFTSRDFFAGELFGPGQPLDTARYFIILPDAIGHGGSSKPSDGLKMAFPAYDYQDIVNAQQRMLREHFGVQRLRLMMGTSMGCMLSFVHATTDPGIARALMPLACLPVELAGRNRMWRKASIDAIKADPAWQGGNYAAPPVMGLRAAALLLWAAGTAPVRMQADYPTRAAAEGALAGLIERLASQSDANDIIYWLDSSRTYNPAPQLGRITVPVTWINSADDFINPPGLRIAEREVTKMPNARFVLIPESADTHGHGTHSWAKFWKGDLVALLARS
ncbi:alpha/beta fold hydrolase [Sphingomonas sp.]|uniref:alpha/beta fold hydrolase n=1 Tax=Sphingomonas sp. TaxID=28214 RepID=UPI001D30583E|nr:alpha/beta fold hydrolase [Sphingomonas sp.]MBX9797336.1 alpha/beta fold hydrolase [Sphingomonas sp.]